MSKSFEQLGCSKINIGLAITGKREDGYHDIDSIFQSIRLSDSIYFAKHHSVVFSGGAPELPKYMQKLVTYGEENLALKALRAVQEYTLQGRRSHSPIKTGTYPSRSWRW